VALLAHFASAVNPQAFFEQHCIRCHGEDKQKGKLRLDGEAWDRTEENKTELWQEVIDRIDSGEMPPEEEPRPLANERSDILSHMRTLLSKTTANAKPKQVTLRRLNRVQYRNTIRDLLLLDLTVDDPTEAFPADDKLEGFDNLGEALQMSDFLLRQYLKVARRLVDRSTFAGHKPEPVTYSLRQEGKIRPKNFSMGRDDPTRSYAVLTSNDERAPGDPRGQSLTNCRDGATHDGYYDFTFEVESQGRGNLTKVFGAQRRKDYPVYRPEDLHRFEIYITAPNKSSAVQTRPRTLVHAIDLPDEERVVIKKRIWLPKEWRVEVGFGNGYWGVVDPILMVDRGKK